MLFTYVYKTISYSTTYTQEYMYVCMFGLQNKKRNLIKYYYNKFKNN